MLAVPFLHDELMCAQPSASDSALQFAMVVDRLDPQGEICMKLQLLRIPEDRVSWARE